MNIVSGTPPVCFEIGLESGHCQAMFNHNKFYLYTLSKNKLTSRPSTAMTIRTYKTRDLRDSWKDLWLIGH